MEQNNSNFEKELQLNKVFPYPSYEDWKVEAVKLLKGAPFDKILKTDTCEGITLNAIYNQEDIKDILYVDTLPGVFPFVRGNTAVKRVSEGWDVQQEIEAGSIKEWNRLIIEALKKGQNSFRLKADEYSFDDAYAFFGIAFKDINISDSLTGKSEIQSFDIEMCYSHLPAFLKYCADKKIDLQGINGSFATDYLKYYVQNGGLPINKDVIFDKIAEATKLAIDAKTNLKTILIDLSIWNDAGSSAVDDLGIMTSIIALCVDELQKRGIEINEIFNRMTFVMAVSNNMFIEIAKLRAARYLFAMMGSEFGIRNSEFGNPNSELKMRIHARTSTYTKTYYDPWVNILRTTTEAFSAIIGGCDSLHVTPFDIAVGKSDEFSSRIARNQQLVLREEAHLHSVNDPAGGSFYVEALTNELIKKGWELFLEIDEKGGFLSALDGMSILKAENKGINEAHIRGFIHTKVDQSHSCRLKNAETRKDNLVGTSIFANLNEKKLDREKADPPFTPKHLRPSANGGKNEPLSKRRLSETFEDLRLTIEKMSPRPEVFVANIGSTVKNKPRVDFAMGFFEPAGFICSTNDGFSSVEEAIEQITNHKSQITNPIIVLSSTDDQYPTIVPEFAKALKEKAPEKILVLAGYPKEHIEAFTQAGVDFYVYMRANVVLTIREMLKKMWV